MLRKITKIVFALMGTLIALGFVTVLSLGLWVMTGPKSLTKLLPYIEASLNPAGSPYRVEIDDALVFWDGWAEPMDFRLRGVAVATLKGDELLKLDELSLGLDKAALLRLKLLPESVVLRNPSIRIIREANGEFYVGIGEWASQRMPLRMLLTGMGSGSADDTLIGDIRLIAIEHAHIAFGTPQQQAAFEAQDANLRIRRIGETITAEMAVAMHFDERPSQIAGTVKIANREEMIAAKMELLDISPHMFAGLLPELPELAMLELPLSGWADVTVDDKGHVTLLDFKLGGKEGTFTHEEHFAEPLAITQAALEGQARDNFSRFRLGKGELHFGEASLSVSGRAQRHEAGWAYEANATAQDMPVNDLYKYWPKSIAPTSYHWVTEHIREGVVPKAEARVKLEPEQLGQPFPKEALEVEIDARGVQVEYLPGHPKVTEVDGLVVFDGAGMTITAQKGRMLSGAVLKDAWLHIPELASHAPRMDIKLAVEAPAKDVAAYLSIPDLAFAQPLGLDPQTIQGQAAGTMEFHFLLPTQNVPDADPQLQFRIEADVTDGAQPGFMEDMNLTAAAGKLAITQETLGFKGMMAISNAPLAVELTHWFAPREFPTEYHATGVLAVPQLALFGLPDMPFAAGNVEIDTRIRRRTGLSNVQGTVNLSQVGVKLPVIGLSKTAGSLAVAQFDVDATPEALAVNSFSLAGDEVNAEGAATIGEQRKKLQSVRFDRLEYGDNNFAFTAQAQGEGYVIRAKGPSLDLKPLFDKEEPRGPQEPQGPEDDRLPFPFDFEGEFGWIVIGKERELRKVKARLQCNRDWCEAADIRGTTGQKNAFAYTIRRMDGVRQLEFSASDAGSFLKAMDVFDNMNGGRLKLDGRFDDSKPERPFSGRLSISEHRITNAPVLARIATLLSLSGIGDALGGKGITFKEMLADMVYVDGVLLLKKGKAYGSSLGITVEDGRIDTGDKSVAVTGTVVPSYTLNTVIDSIPVIGSVLTGGKGEGVFAATYKVTGTYPDNTEVSVNPLSMLAPGFLRDIFGAGADKVKVPEKEKAQPQPETQQPAAAPAAQAPAPAAPAPSGG